jgi:hypothetical protein
MTPRASPVVAVQRLGLPDGREGIGEEQGQLGGQGGRVLFDGEHDVPARGTPPADEGRLGRKRSGGTDAPIAGEIGDQGLGDGNRVGLRSYGRLQQRLLAGVGVERQEMRCRMRAGAGTTHRLAIDSHRLTNLRGPGGPHPSRQRPFQVRDPQPRPEAPVERTGRREERPGAEDAGEQWLMGDAPLLDGVRRSALAQPRRHPAGQQKRQRGALSASGARIGQRGEDSHQAGQARIAEECLPLAIRPRGQVGEGLVERGRIHGQVLSRWQA